MSAATDPAPPLDKPYKGLASFTEKDGAIFFGRERERKVIIANLRARRIMVLYGESGVGKTSLLRAGVVPDLFALAQRNLERRGTPEFIPVVFSDWRDDPLPRLIASIEASAQRFTSTPLRLNWRRGLVKAIERATKDADAYLLVILDQFEEYFLYHADEIGRQADERPAEALADPLQRADDDELADEEEDPDAEETNPRAFADELQRAIAKPGLQAGFLISIRDDAVAKLDRFKERIPGLFDTFIRVEHLDAKAAEEAIRRPLDEYNARVGPDLQVEVKEPLIRAVLEQVRTGEIVLTQAGQGTVERANGEQPGKGTARGRRPLQPGDRIETPYLQLVMARLWDELGAP